MEVLNVTSGYDEPLYVLPFDHRATFSKFDFEYGPDFAIHIEKFNPTFCKVLVRYNPGGDTALNQRQAVRLRRLSDYLHGCGRQFMFELLVPPEPDQLRRLGNDRNA
jgi:5-dehydro-2-deoxygluconokinase